MRDREKKREKGNVEKEVSKEEKKEHLLVSAYCVFVTQGEIVTT